MPAPQLSVRSAKARDLAHHLSAEEKRPIHAIVEDALVALANRQPKESAEAFLRRLGAIGGKETKDDLADLEAFISENRKPIPALICDPDRHQCHFRIDEKACERAGGGLVSGS